MPEFKQMLPDFTLDSSDGVEVRASQYRGKKNLVLALLGGVPGAAMEWLNALARRVDGLEEENARVLVMVRDTPQQARALRAELDAPFIFMADCDGGVHRRFDVGKEASVVIVTDRYGEIYSVERGLPDPADVIASLRHINIMCDE